MGKIFHRRERRGRRDKKGKARNPTRRDAIVAAGTNSNEKNSKKKNAKILDKIVSRQGAKSQSEDERKL